MIFRMIPKYCVCTIDLVCTRSKIMHVVITIQLLNGVQKEVYVCEWILVLSSYDAYPLISCAHEISRINSKLKLNRQINVLNVRTHTITFFMTSSNCKTQA